MKTRIKIAISLMGTVMILASGLMISGCKSKSKVEVLSKADLESKITETSKAKEEGIVKYDIEDKKFTGYLLEIKNQKRVKVGYTKLLGKDGETTSKMAQDNNAIAAINGGMFREESSITPDRLLISKGNVILDNGKINSVMGINKDGMLIVGKYSIEDLKRLEVTEAVSTFPILILDGVGQIKDPEELGVNSRTAIGQKRDGTIVMLVLDGRQGLKVGATLKEVQDIMLQHDVVNAINLDGGSSSTMYYKGEVINKPCSSEGERRIASIIYVENENN